MHPSAFILTCELFDTHRLCQIEIRSRQPLASLPHLRFVLCPSCGCWLRDHKCVRPRAGSTPWLSFAQNVNDVTKEQCPHICFLPTFARTRIHGRAIPNYPAW